jgi:hypothetical protein
MENQKICGKHSAFVNNGFSERTKQENDKNWDAKQFGGVPIHWYTYQFYRYSFQFFSTRCSLDREELASTRPLNMKPMWHLSKQTLKCTSGSAEHSYRWTVNRCSSRTQCQSIGVRTREVGVAKLANCTTADGTCKVYWLLKQNNTHSSRICTRSSTDWRRTFLQLKRCRNECITNISTDRYQIDRQISANKRWWTCERSVSLTLARSYLSSHRDLWRTTPHIFGAACSFCDRFA